MHGSTADGGAYLTSTIAIDDAHDVSIIGRGIARPPRGYDDGRMVKGITFEGIKIDGRRLHDRMKGKPAWHSTADYVPMYVGNHVADILFRADSDRY